MATTYVNVFVGPMGNAYTGSVWYSASDANIASEIMEHDWRCILRIARGKSGRVTVRVLKPQRQRSRARGK